MRAVFIKYRTKIVERTELLTDGDDWQVVCSCGYKSRVFRRKATAMRHLVAHYNRVVKSALG